MENSEEARKLGQAIESSLGVMTASTLGAEGLGWKARRSRVRNGEFVRVRRRTYVAAAAPRSYETSVRIALAPRAARCVASHQSAAHLHGLLRFAPKEVHIARAISGGPPRQVAGIRVHRTPDLREDEVAEINGIRVTTIERTIEDLARSATTRSDRRLLRFALRSALKHERDLAVRLRARADARGKRRGGRILRDALDEWAVTGDARSLLEVAFLDFCRDYGLPLPRTNVVVAGAERDAVWVDERVIAEIDTQTHHTDDVAFQRDRDRRNDATEAGWRVVQITPLSIGRDADRTAALFYRLLGTATSRV
jgi:hypothetical protein